MIETDQKFFEIRVLYSYSPERVFTGLQAMLDDTILAKRSNDFMLPTKYGTFSAQVFEAEDGNMPMIIYMGDFTTLANNSLVRIHSECLTSEVFGSLRCDCAEQLKEAMYRIAREKNGMVIYLRQEGRGIGLLNKANAYSLQQKEGLDTIEANRKLGFEEDLRDYSFAIQVLNAFSMKSIRLMTNNPNKIKAIIKANIQVTIEPLEIAPEEENIAYLRTKKEKLNHLLKLV